MRSERDARLEELLLEDILSEIVILDDEPTPARLSQLCQDHPRWRKEFYEFFETWREQMEFGGGDAPEETSEELDNRRQSVCARGLAQALALLTQRHCTDQDGADGPVRLSAILRNFGLDEARFARACGLDRAIMSKMDRRCIQPAEDIPLRCFELMSEIVVRNVGAEQSGAPSKKALIQILQGAVIGAPVDIERGVLAFFRRRSPTQSFAQAIESSSLSEDEKRLWLDANVADTV